MKKTLLLIVMLLGACAAPRTTLPPPPEAGILLQKLESEQDRWRELDAAAQVGFKRDGKSLSTRQFMLLERPDRLRVDVLTLFSQLALQLTVADGELEVFLNNPAPGQYYRGPASDALLARFTRVPLRAAELVQLLLHAPPWMKDAPSRVEVAGERYRLTLDAGTQRQQFYFDAELLLRRCVYLQGTQVLLAVDYDQFDAENHFPRRVQIELPQQETRLAVVFSELRLNQGIKPGRFDLQPPSNALPLLIPGINLPEEKT